MPSCLPATPRLACSEDWFPATSLKAALAPQGDGGGVFVGIGGVIRFRVLDLAGEDIPDQFA
jgi:hypothetical protein